MTTKASKQSDKLPNWSKSSTRQKLLRMIEDGTITEDVTPTAVYELDPEFKKHPYGRQFRPNLRGLRNQVILRRPYVESDKSAYAHDRKLNPICEVNSNGVPRWRGSEAQRLLRSDVDEGRHIRMKPETLRMTRPQYRQFSLKAFRDHIYQDVRSRRASNYWLKKQADTLKKARGESTDDGNEDITEVKDLPTVI